MSFSPTVIKCPEIMQNVRTDQSEAECRSQHECEQACCPLAADFDQDKFNFFVSVSGSSYRPGK